MKKIFNRQNGVKSIFVLMMVVAVIIVLLLNIVSTALVSRYPLEIDLTGNKAFALDDATLSYLEALETPVTIQVLATEERFAGTSTYNAQANEVMQQFAKHARNVSIEYIDYIKDPTFAARYPELTIKHGDIMVTGPEQYKLVKTEELFNYTQTQNGKVSIASSKAEQAILSAILYVTSTEIPTVTLVTGHNETDVSAFTALLQQNNFAMQTVQLATQDIAPETDVLLLAAPKADLSAQELEKLDAYLEQGGSYGKTFFYCADAEQPALPNLEAFLAEWGAVPADGAVFETDENRVYNYHPFYAVVDYKSETYQSGLRSTDVPMLMPVSRPLDVLFDYQDNYSTDVLLAFGESAGVRPGDAGSDFTADDATRRGPIPALVRCDYTLRQGDNANTVAARSTVLVSGSTAMLESYAIEGDSFSNAAYLINLFNDVCSRTDTISVTPKTIAGSSLNLTQQQADRLGTLFVGIIPAFTLLFGLAVWLMRRHK